ncbi:TraB/GumN family protein [Luteimonas sp. MC1825]|uniref:TraB/GumN family protein n=1 Tax=Luteimonas sp. MC1825 TaxID=2761107 RepID=UPI001622EF1D|nr:TraB/GumN family protein [Luteimonas sp. MC1825]MBB6599800.1 TraB/GumN family protein [Luteimonas sp. MC1825]QOC87475.1 TraB/GumN family protein [Luteimonas sp. MC1825]
MTLSQSVRRRGQAWAVAGVLCLVAVGKLAGAQPAAPTSGPAIRDLEALVVSGTRPGPGMWKVSKGGHVLHILGTVSPLPRRMDWNSADVEAVIARSQAVIEAPYVAVNSDIGMFRGLALVPAMLRARNNPAKRPLRDVVSADLYARWQLLKARYMGHDRGVEKRRPLVAAQELYEAALKKSGLRMGGVVTPVVRRAARDAGVPLVESKVALTLEDPKAVLKELNDSDLADRECFAGTMARIETDLDNMRARANAWADGDLEALGALPYDDHYRTCMEALTASALARRLGFNDLRARADQAWLANADKALAENPVSFAALPMSQLLAEDGLLAQLRERGYEIQAP